MENLDEYRNFDFNFDEFKIMIFFSNYAKIETVINHIIYKSKYYTKFGKYNNLDKIVKM